MGGSPWYALPRGLLHVHEVGKDAEFGGGGGDHDYQPEIELGFGPVVFAPAFGDADDLGRHVEGGGDGREEGREREAGVPRGSVDLMCLSKRRSAVKVQRVGRWRELWQCAGRWALFASYRGRSRLGRCPTLALQLYQDLCSSVH